VRGELWLVAAALAWPAAGGLVLALRRPAPARRWRVLAWTAVAATVTAVGLLVVAGVLLARGGTSPAMASLGYQLGAAASLAGAVVCGGLAGVLRFSGKVEPPGPDRTDR
jgi:hypothetical protein